MAVKIIEELKQLMHTNADKTTKGSISPTDVFLTMEHLLDTLNKFGGDKIDQIFKDLGEGSRSNVQITSGISNNYINLNGLTTFNESYSISNRINLTKGFIYLMKLTNVIGDNVSLFSKYLESPEVISLNYVYEYNSDNRIIKATNNLGEIYNYTYVIDEMGVVHRTITKLGGSVVFNLPLTRELPAGSYIPLFTKGSLRISNSGYVSYVCTEDMKGVISAMTSDIINGVMYKVDYGSFYSLVDSLATKKYMNREVAYVNENIQEIETTISDINLGLQNYCVAEYDPNSNSPDTLKLYGSKSILDEWRYYLVYVYDIIEGKLNIKGELMPNNFLRYINGEFAPTVCIDQDQYNDCMDYKLYLSPDLDPTSIYCNPGEFNPLDFYEEYGMDQKLYRGEYGYPSIEVRPIRPWDVLNLNSGSEDDGGSYTIGIARDHTIYVLDGQIGSSGKAWKGIFKQPIVWDGIDVSKFKLEPTLMTLNAVAGLVGESRGFYFAYYGGGGINDSGSKGTDNLVTEWDSKTINKRFPHHNSNENNLRSLCKNTGSAWDSVGYMTYNAFLISQELLYETNNLHVENRFGSGISSNELCYDRKSFYHNGGIRYRSSELSDWNYANFSSELEIYNSSGVSYSANNFLNLNFPLEECYESQIVSSYIKEVGVEPTIEDNIENPILFEWEGGIYYWVKIPKIRNKIPKNPLDGRLNLKLYRIKSFEIGAYDSYSNLTTFTVEVCLRMSLCNGVKLCGDNYITKMGGLELVGSKVGTVNKTKAYIQPNPSNWDISPNLVGISTSDNWDFENLFMLVGEFNATTGYISGKFPSSPLPKSIGGNLHTKDCGYFDGNSYWYQEGLKVRQCRRFGGESSSINCAPRSIKCDRSLSDSNLVGGVMAQALLNLD